MTSNNLIGQATRTELGLSQTAPASVTSYTATVMGFPMYGIDGTDGADSITGTSTTSYIFGMGGDDTIDAGAGTPVMIGGTGSDVFKIGTNNTMGLPSAGSIGDFELGSDRIDLSATTLTSFSQLTISPGTSDGEAFANITASTGLNVIVTGLSSLSSMDASSFIFSGDGGGDDDGADDDELTGTTGSDSFEGGLGDDIITALLGNDICFGNQGIDILYGNQGNDNLYGGQGNDTVFGGQDNDYVYGNLDIDRVLGNYGDDFVHGGGGDDFCHGGRDDDTLNGGTGDDTLNGGTGDDVFIFGNITNGDDHIVGFEGAGVDGGDLIQIVSTLITGSVDTELTFSGGDSIIALLDGSTITVEDVTISAGDISLV